MLERLPIEAETALALEEAEHLLRQLTALTEKPVEEMKELYNNRDIEA